MTSTPPSDEAESTEPVDPAIDPSIERLADDVPLVVGAYLRADRVASYRHVTDAHLVAVARRRGASLAALDRGIATLAGGEDVTLVPLT